MIFSMVYQDRLCRVDCRFSYDIYCCRCIPEPNTKNVNDAKNLLLIFIFVLTNSLTVTFIEGSSLSCQVAVEGHCLPQVKSP